MRRHANDYHAGRVVLLGDAAHTINPLAGQGVNLGFKDVACWADLLHSAGAEWHKPELATRYERRRRPDNLLMQSGMDLFYGVFSNEIGPSNWPATWPSIWRTRRARSRRWRYAMRWGWFKARGAIMRRRAHEQGIAGDRFHQRHRPPGRAHRCLGGPCAGTGRHRARQPGAGPCPRPRLAGGADQGGL